MSVAPSERALVICAKVASFHNIKLEDLPFNPQIILALNMPVGGKLWKSRCVLYVGVC